MDKLEEITIIISRIKRENRQAKKLHRTVYGDMPCPVCGKRLDWKIDGYRWHSQGVCVTPDCIDWRE